MNPVITSSLEYHQNTEYHRNTLGGHALDWTNQPDVYKRYQDIIPNSLPKGNPATQQDLWQISKNKGSSIPPDINFRTVSDILHLTNTLTAKVKYPGQEFYYRSAASAGALYPNELYLATRDIPDLEPGLYHYGIRNSDLTPLRRQDVTEAVVNSMDVHPEKTPVVTFLITGIFFRSSWKYRSRAYRYVLLDAGHLLENLILALRFFSFRFSIHYDFQDHQLNHIIGANGIQESCIAVVNVHGGLPADLKHRNEEILPLSETIIQASQVAVQEKEYPEIQGIHRAGIGRNHLSGADIIFDNDLGVSPKSWHAINWDGTKSPGPKYPDVLFRRRSKRNFIPKPLARHDFYSLLDLFCNSYAGLEKENPYVASVQIGFLANHIDGMEPGFYLVNPVTRKIGLVASGQFAGPMTDACLNQEWLVNASVHFLLMTNLRLLDQQWGARGYRYAMMTAGKLGQDAYLGATALELGCCGIGAFYDDEARAILDLNRDSALLYLVAAGFVKRK